MRMRGDQLARQRRVLRAIEASPNGLTPAELAKREDNGIRTIVRDPGALQEAGFPLPTKRVEGANRWAAIDTFKSKISPLFTLTPSEVFLLKSNFVIPEERAQNSSRSQFVTLNQGLNIKYPPYAFTELGAARSHSPTYAIWPEGNSRESEVSGL
jgi:hypothetical protein